MDTFTPTTAAHVDKSTLAVAFYDPEHAQRVTTALFTRTRGEILKNETLCWLCGQPASVVGPLELHHNTVERMFAEVIDWNLLKAAHESESISWQRPDFIELELRAECQQL